MKITENTSELRSPFSVRKSMQIKKDREAVEAKSLKSLNI